MVDGEEKCDTGVIREIVTKDTHILGGLGSKDSGRAVIDFACELKTRIGRIL